LRDDPGGLSESLVPNPSPLLPGSAQPLPGPAPAPAVAPDRAAGARSDVQIPAGKQRIELRYTGMSFTAPDKVKFRWRLKGLEADWVDGGDRHAVSYDFLPPGDYQFEVRACNNDGVWNETGASAINFAGSLTNNAATFTANTGTHTFSGVTDTLSGSTATAISTVTFPAGSSYANNGTLSVATLLTVTGTGVLTNNGTITATTALSGTGSVTQEQQAFSTSAALPASPR